MRFFFSLTKVVHIAYIYIKYTYIWNNLVNRELYLSELLLCFMCMNIFIFNIITDFFFINIKLFFFICITNTAKNHCFCFLNALAEDFLCYIQDIWLILLFFPYETIWNLGIDFVVKLTQIGNENIYAEIIFLHIFFIERSNREEDFMFILKKVFIWRVKSFLISPPGYLSVGLPRANSFMFYLLIHFQFLFYRLFISDMRYAISSELRRD